MRERYAGALGRFAVNPDLESESAILGELGTQFTGSTGTVNLTVFATITQNSIDQEIVTVDGEIKRMRVNLEGSRNFGIEIAGDVRPVRGLRIEGNAMMSYLRAFDEQTGSYDRRLTERPGLLGAIRASYNGTGGYNIGGELAYTGDSYSLDDTGVYVKLGAAAVLNLRAGYRLLFGSVSRVGLEFYVRSYNVGDAVVENQLGLPAPGRSMSAGLMFSL